MNSCMHHFMASLYRLVGSTISISPIYKDSPCVLQYPWCLHMTLHSPYNNRRNIKSHPQTPPVKPRKHPRQSNLWHNRTQIKFPTTPTAQPNAQLRRSAPRRKDDNPVLNRKVAMDKVRVLFSSSPHLKVSVSFWGCHWREYVERDHHTCCGGEIVMSLGLDWISRQGLQYNPRRHAGDGGQPAPQLTVLMRAYKEDGAFATTHIQLATLPVLFVS